MIGGGVVKIKQTKYKNCLKYYNRNSTKKNKLLIQFVANSSNIITLIKHLEICH
jgi:hypothetical protein